MTDDGLPEINRSPAPCGAPSNPHIVRSPTDLVCQSCGANLVEMLRERARAAAEGAKGG